MIRDIYAMDYVIFMCVCVCGICVCVWSIHVCVIISASPLCPTYVLAHVPTVRNLRIKVEEYLDYGVLPQEARDEKGNTLLHKAVQQGDKVGHSVRPHLDSITKMHLFQNPHAYYHRQYQYQYNRCQ